MPVTLHDLDVIWDDIKCSTFPLNKDEISAEWAIQIERLYSEVPHLTRTLYLLELLDKILVCAVSVIDEKQALWIKGFLDLTEDGKTYKEAYKAITLNIA